MKKCPKCGSAEVVKNGRHLGRQRHRCKKCGFQYTKLQPKGRPAKERALACLLYSLGVPLSVIADIVDVSPPAVLRWIRSFFGPGFERPSVRNISLCHPTELFAEVGNIITEPESLVLAVPLAALHGPVGLRIES